MVRIKSFQNVLVLGDSDQIMKIFFLLLIYLLGSSNNEAFFPRHLYGWLPDLCNGIHKMIFLVVYSLLDLLLVSLGREKHSRKQVFDFKNWSFRANESNLVLGRTFIWAILSSPTDTFTLNGARHKVENC